MNKENPTEGGARRRAALRRLTRETEIRLALDLDGGSRPGGPGRPRIATGIGFLDHMLSSLAFHAGWELSLACTGDLVIDDHHSVEDCGIALGEALRLALGRAGAPRRFGSAYAPLDESLSRAVVDLSGRPFASVELGLGEGRIGTMAAENLGHFMSSFAVSGRMTLHVDTLRGQNVHHRAESAFKALALALKEACALEVRNIEGTTMTKSDSTKGSVLVEDLGEAGYEALRASLAGEAG